MDLTRAKHLIEAAPAGVTQPDGLTFTRLGPDGGALHTGGADGIVYAACKLASVDNCPEELDPAMELITAAPALLVAAIAEIHRLKACLTGAASGCVTAGMPELAGVMIQARDAVGPLGASL